MQFDITSEVIAPGIGKIIDEHKQEFSDDSNEFGRALDYHNYMYSKFPGCKFRLIEAKEVKHGIY